LGQLLPVTGWIGLCCFYPVSGRVIDLISYPFWIL